MTPTTPAADTLRAAVGRVGLATATDAELVRRFADHRDDLAFAELVHRFAPPVYAVCRRHLPDPGTADDAFQAVFILLARKAGTLVHPNRVGGWLTGTADRVARTARRRQFRRTAQLRPLDSVPEPSAPDPAPSDLRTILDDELTKLPPHYRAVVLLCDVEGVSRRDAASQLNIPTGTLSNRLTRARAVLGRRLLRRGVLVSAGAVVSSGSLASPPARLLASAVRVALADSPPFELIALFPPEVLPMPRGKLLAVLVCGLVLAGGATTGVVLVLQTPTTTGATTGEAQPESSKPTKPETRATFAMSMEEVEKMQPKPRLPQDRTGAFAFTLDGGRMVSAPNDWSHDDSKVVVYDTENWKPVATLDIVREGAIVTGLAITPDGKRVFIAGLRGGNIRVWDVTAKKYEETQFDLGGLKFDRWRLRMAPDGKALVAGMFSFDDGVGSFRVWDVSSGKVIRTFDSRHTAADGFRFIDGGAAVAALTWTGTREDVTAWVGEWDLATGKEKQRIDVRKAVGGDRGPLTAVVEYSADGKHVVIGGGFRLADEPPPPPDSYRNTFPYSGSVWVIDRQSGKLVKTLIDRRYDLVRSLHLTHDAKKLIVNPEFPSRWERRLESDAEFVELQQWDVATWELDWVKIVPKAERWKLWNGAAK